MWILKYKPFTPWTYTKEDYYKMPRDTIIFIIKSINELDDYIFLTYEDIGRYMSWVCPFMKYMRITRDKIHEERIILKKLLNKTSQRIKC